MSVPPIGFGLLLAMAYLYIRLNYMGHLLRIFQEKPLFVVPRGEKLPGAEDVIIPANDGLKLRGC